MMQALVSMVTDHTCCAEDRSKQVFLYVYDVRY